MTEGHPDKMADQVSDAVLDAILAADPHGPGGVRDARRRPVWSSWPARSPPTAYVDIPKLVRQTVCDIGYDRESYGFDGNTCGVVVSIDEQSPDIAQGVDQRRSRSAPVRRGEDILNAQGAGDQGMMFGYACDETADLMPLPIWLAHRLAQRLAEVRKTEKLDYLRPDGKTQVTVDYDDGRPVRLRTVLISTQTAPGIDRLGQLLPELTEHVISPVIPERVRRRRLRVLVNPTGIFELGGPHADTGLTGRKIIVDTYGGAARHGGGAFSGKDPSKVDRSAAYAARWVAKHVVASGAARRCEIQVAYAIGVAHPVSIMVETFGTEQVDPAAIEKAVREVFDLRPAAIIRDLDLRQPDLPPHRGLRPLRPLRGGLHLGGDVPPRRPEVGARRSERSRRPRRGSVRVAVDVPALADQGRELDYLVPAGARPIGHGRHDGARPAARPAGRRVGRRHRRRAARRGAPPAGRHGHGLGPAADVVELTAGRRGGGPGGAPRCCGPPRRPACVRALPPPGAAVARRTSAPAGVAPGVGRARRWPPARRSCRVPPAGRPVRPLRARRCLGAGPAPGRDRPSRRRRRRA